MWAGDGTNQTGVGKVRKKSGSVSQIPGTPEEGTTLSGIYLKQGREESQLMEGFQVVL